MKMLVFFSGKMCSERRKNHGCGQNKPKSTSSAIFGVETAAKKLRTQVVCRPSSNRTDGANLNFSPELYRLIFFASKLNFSRSHQKDNWVFFWTFFSLTNLFLTFVVFACFATTRVNMRFRAKNTWDSAQGYIQCMKCIGNPVVRTEGWTYVRTVTWLLRHYQNLNGLIGYQISLAM